MATFGTQNGQSAQVAQGQQNNNSFMFIGEESFSDFVKAHPNAGFITFNRKNPVTFVNRKGQQKTLTTITFVKEVFTDAQGNKTQGVTLAVVSSEFDTSKPAKIAIATWKTQVADPKTGQVHDEWVVQKMLCNVGENASGTFNGMLSELI